MTEKIMTPFTITLRPICNITTYISTKLAEVNTTEQTMVVPSLCLPQGLPVLERLTTDRFEPQFPWFPCEALSTA